VQTARYFVAVVIEFASGVKHGHNHFQRRLLLCGMHVDRDTAPVILDSAGAVGIDGDFDVIAETRHSLVDRVIYHLVNQMVQSACADIADIHGRATAHCF
jgi:hypothetical protein